MRCLRELDPTRPATTPHLHGRLKLALGCLEDNADHFDLDDVAAAVGNEKGLTCHGDSGRVEPSSNAAVPLVGSTGLCNSESLHAASVHPGVDPDSDRRSGRWAVRNSWSSASA